MKSLIYKSWWADLHQGSLGVVNKKNELNHQMIVLGWNSSLTG